MAKTIQHIPKSVPRGTTVHFFPDSESYERFDKATELFERAEQDAKAHPEGLVALSMPAFAEMRLQGGVKSPLWRVWTYASEEFADGQYVVTFHPGLVQGEVVPDLRHWSSERISAAFDAGLTSTYAGKVDPAVMKELRKGIVNGTQVEKYTLSDVKSRSIPLDEACVVVRRQTESQAAPSDYIDSAEEFADDPNVQARLLDSDRAGRYFRMARERYNTERIGDWHAFDRVEKGVPEGRGLVVGGSNYGLGGDDGLRNDGRLSGVAPEELSALTRDDVERIFQWNLDQILAIDPEDASSAKEEDFTKAMNALCNFRSAITPLYKK